MPKGMMLAAGRGTRLGPLTEYLPKPLLPVANRPVIQRGIDSLLRLGITEIGVNVSYRGTQIQDIFPHPSQLPYQLHWSLEQEPTGTAGGLKGLQHKLGDDTVVVIAGDAMLDVDLTAVLAVHEQCGAFATLATLEVADPSLFGVVETAADGRIIRFQEKPAPGTAISKQANTGIYIFNTGIFDLIPAGNFYDFALHVFPEILRLGLPFIATPVQGYWTDIGNPGDYLQANLDFLAGHVCVQGHGTLCDGNLLAPGACVEGVSLSNCVVGENAVLAAGSILHNCVVWPNVHLTAAVTLHSAILTPWDIYQVTGKSISTVAASLHYS